mmetsp:Transcript_23156/g.66455  ORF Transcript_23156/g.66455 Transcript_23156/m.66455 type:complete len:208 (-) Transcript_23156:94-717(-)
MRAHAPSRARSPRAPLPRIPSCRAEPTRAKLPSAPAPGSNLRGGGTATAGTMCRSRGRRTGTSKAAIYALPRPRCCKRRSCNGRGTRPCAASCAHRAPSAGAGRPRWRRPTPRRAPNPSSAARTRNLLPGIEAGRGLSSGHACSPSRSGDRGPPGIASQDRSRPPCRSGTGRSRPRRGRRRCWARGPPRDRSGSRSSRLPWTHRSAT